MRFSRFVLYGLLSVSISAWGDGPADRKPTDPLSVASTAGPASTPLPVEALLTTTRIAGVAHSRDGRLLAYISNASGRPNLWVMNVDGTAARQLIKSNDRQTATRFTYDDAAIVYSQDRGGNEYYDIYVVPVNGGEPRNLTHSDDVSETVYEFSPDGKTLAIGIKQKASPSTDLAVMEWPSGTIRQLTHETDRKASWSEDAWSADGRWIYATRYAGIDDSDIFTIDVATGKAEKLLEHTGKQLITVADVAPGGRTALITSNAKGGYENVAVLDLKSKKLRWLTDTQWSADGVGFTPDGSGAVYVLNADGRVSTRFVNLKTKVESERGVPAGMNTPAAAPTPFCPDGSMLLAHKDQATLKNCTGLPKKTRSRRSPITPTTRCSMDLASLTTRHL